MSKVICDVCGTAFPETDSQCPLCGCAKSPVAQSVVSEAPQPDTEKTVGGTYAKGGRFAKGNVKHTPAFAAPKTPERRRRDNRNEEQPQESNKGLVAVVIVLLLAIIMVVVYIGVSVFLGGLTNLPNNDSSKPSAEATLESTETTDATELPCIDLTLGSLTVEFEGENEQHLLEVVVDPVDTTDELVFTSADPDVATVDQNGLIIPVGYGQTVITVTCGDVTKECTVICTFGETEPTTEPTQPVATAPAGFELKLNRKDFTLGYEGETWRLFKDTEDVKASDITWTVDDPSIATVENGVVTGVDRGTTTVTAMIGDQVVTCIVRCAFDAADPEETVGITISDSDVTLYSGDVFYLSLKNPDSSKVQDIEWTASVEGLVEIDGNKITVLEIAEKTIIEITTEHEGVTYTCTMRLYPPKTDATESET